MNLKGFVRYSQILLSSNVIFLLVDVFHSFFPNRVRGAKRAFKMDEFESGKGCILSMGDIQSSSVPSSILDDEAFQL